MYFATRQLIMTKHMDKSLMINKVNPCKYTRVVY